MKHTTKFVALAVLGLALIGGGRVEASTLAYDNGPVNGTLSAWTIDYGYVVSDSFTVTSPTDLTSASIGLWVSEGDTPSTVEWSIGTSQYGSDISSGTATLSNTYLSTNTVYGYDIYQSSFSLSGLVQAGTTYWFTLQNAVTAGSNVAYWDINNGPSVAFENSIGNVVNQLFPGSNSDSFQLYGTQCVPEPSSFVLAGLGAIGGLGTMCARRRRGRASS